MDELSHEDAHLVGEAIQQAVKDVDTPSTGDLRGTLFAKTIAERIRLVLSDMVSDERAKLLLAQIEMTLRDESGTHSVDFSITDGDDDA